MQLLTNSRLTTFRRCMREEKLRYQMGLESVSSGAQQFGTLIHKGLEAWWRGEDWPNAITDGGDPYDIAKARAMIAGYHARWVNESLAAIAVESEFRIPFMNPETGEPSNDFTLAGKMDVIVRDERKDVWVMEHKSSNQDISPGSKYVEHLKIDPQVSMYFRAARAMGLEPVGVIYDILGKPGIRPLRANSKRSAEETPAEYGERCVSAIAEDPDRYHQRVKVVRLETEVAEFDRDIWQQSEMLEEAMSKGVAPRNPDACNRFGSLCSYFAICCGEESADDPKWQRNKGDGVNTELDTERESAT